MPSPIHPWLDKFARFECSIKAKALFRDGKGLALPRHCNLDDMTTVSEDIPTGVEAKSPFPIVTAILFLANISAFAGSVYYGMDWVEPKVETLLALGGNVAPLSLIGEQYRLFSSIFLHGGIFHLLANMYMLLVVGMLAERCFGRIPFLMLFLVSGIWGSLVSAFWYGHHKVTGMQFVWGMVVETSGLKPIVSVGASGAIMGITGACLMARLIEINQFDPSEHRLAGTGKSIAQVLMINLFMGFGLSGIDQAAHIGGAMAGMLFGGAIFLICGEHTFKQQVYVVMIGVVALVGANAIASQEPSEDLRELKQALDNEAQERAEAVALTKRKENIQKIADDDVRNAPKPVADKEAGGSLIDLQLDSGRDFQIGAGGKYLYVTSGEENLLKIVDLEGNAPGRIIKGQVWPKSKTDGCSHNMCRGYGATGFAVSKDERFAYVASMSLDALSIVDITAGQIVATIPVGRYPGKVMLSADEKYAFVMNGPDNSYSVIDLDSRTALAPPVVLKGGEVNDSFGRRLKAWMSHRGTVANFYDKNSNTVARFSTETLHAQDEISLGDVLVEDIVPLDDQKWLIRNRDSLLVYDLKKKETHIEFLACDGDINSDVMAMNPDKSLLAIAGRYGEILLVRLASGKAIGRYPTERNVAALRFSADGKTIYALHPQGQISVMELGKSAMIQEAERDVYCLPPNKAAGR